MVVADPQSLNFQWNERVVCSNFMVVRSKPIGVGIEDSFFIREDVRGGCSPLDQAEPQP